MESLIYDPRQKQSRAARHTFLWSVAVFVIAALIAAGLILATGNPVRSAGLKLPPAFLLSTVLLLVGSTSLHRSLMAVRREKQSVFRRRLLAAAGLGTLFVSVQSYGMWYMLQSGTADADAQTGAHAFVFVFVALHAMHFVVAVLFLVFVTVRAHADRYDHEYHWGVTVCAWFWHVLGLVWLAILSVFAIVV